MGTYRSIVWANGVVRMIDQRVLPQKEIYLDYTDYNEVAEAIRVMVIRGAPAIGAAAGYGLALAALRSKAVSVADLRQEMEKAALVLRQARPTAVNLFWAIDRVMDKVRKGQFDTTTDLSEMVLKEAHAIADEDAEMCKRISQNGQAVVPEHPVFIHHCNTGALATVDYGTALGVIRMAHELGKDVFVYVDETRPRLQGARLTSWELTQLGVPHAVMADGASGFIMKRKGVNIVTVGCDRVAANGDAANKIGTYNLAIVAKAHKVPFYIVGPTSTIDLATPTGDQIEIEERPAEEVTFIDQHPITPLGAKAANPAFDVTPAEYITGIITEEGIAYPDFKTSLVEMVKRAEERRAERAEK